MSILKLNRETEAPEPCGGLSCLWK